MVEVISNVEVVGGFDSVFGNKEKGRWGYEDVDWSYRAQCLGFKLKWIGHPTAFPFYHIDTTLKPKSESQAEALLKAQSILHAKYDMNEINAFNRTVYPFTREQMEASMNGINLNIGCYYTSIPGFINVDIKDDCGADLVCNMKDLHNHFKENSVSVILASQSLEHITKDEAVYTLTMWNKLLKPGGHLIVEVPDCEDMDARIARGEMTEADKRCHIEGTPHEFGQKHEHCYTEGELRNILINTGYRVLARNPNVSDQYALRLDCIKE